MTNKTTKKSGSKSSGSRSEVARLRAENTELKNDLRNLQRKLDQALAKIDHLISVSTNSIMSHKTTDAVPLPTTPTDHPTLDIEMEEDTNPPRENEFPPPLEDSGGILRKRRVNLDSIEAEAKRNKQESDNASDPLQIAPTSNAATGVNPNAKTIQNNPTSPNNQSPAQQTGSTKKPPAIIAEKVDTKSLVADLQSRLGHGDFTFQTVNSKKKRIQAKTKESRTVIPQVLKEKGVEAYSHTPRDERSTTVLLKKVCHTYDRDDVCEALKAEFPNVEFSRIEKFEVPPRFTKTNPDRYKNVNIWQLTIPPGADVRAILKTTRLDVIKQIVSFEVYHSEDIPLCKICKQWDHTKNNCQMFWKCSRCTSDHARGKCQVPEAQFDEKTGIQKEETLPTCRNCGKKGHPATYRCEAYYRVKKNKEEARKKQQASITEKARFVDSYRKKGVSFSSKLKAPTKESSTTPRTQPPTTTSTATHVQDSEPSPSLSFECMQKFFKLAEEIRPSYNNLTSSTDKQALIGCSVLKLILNNGS